MNNTMTGNSNKKSKKSRNSFAADSDIISIKS